MISQAQAKAFLVRIGRAQTASEDLTVAETHTFLGHLAHVFGTTQHALSDFLGTPGVHPQAEAFVLHQLQAPTHHETEGSIQEAQDASYALVQDATLVEELLAGNQVEAPAPVFVDEADEADMDLGTGDSTPVVDPEDELGFGSVTDPVAGGTDEPVVPTATDASTTPVIEEGAVFDGTGAADPVEDAAQ